MLGLTSGLDKVVVVANQTQSYFSVTQTTGNASRIHNAGRSRDAEGSQLLRSTGRSDPEPVYLKGSSIR